MRKLRDGCFFARFLAATCIVLINIPSSALNIEDRKNSYARIQIENSIRAVIAAHSEGEAASARTGPQAYFDSFTTLRPFEKRFLLSQIKGLPRPLKIKPIEKGFLLGNDEMRFEVKILNMQAKRLSVNGRSLDFSNAVTAVEVYRSLHETLAEDTSLYSALLPAFFPTAHAFINFGALFAKLAALIMQLLTGSGGASAGGGASSNSNADADDHGSAPVFQPSASEAPAPSPSPVAPAAGQPQRNSSCTDLVPARNNIVTGPSDMTTKPNVEESFNSQMMSALDGGTLPLPDKAMNSRGVDVGYKNSSTSLNRLEKVKANASTLSIPPFQKGDTLYCSAAVDHNLLRAINLYSEKSPSSDSSYSAHLDYDSSDGHGSWGRRNANGFGFAHWVADMDIGLNFLDKKGIYAQSGDVLKIIRNPTHVGTRESGHLVTFRGYKKDENGVPQKVCYWSANQEGGAGTQCEDIGESTLVFSRITKPENIGNTAKQSALAQPDLYLEGLTNKDDPRPISEALKVAGVAQDCS